MGFKIIHGSQQKLWAPITYQDTIYVGQIVKCQTDEGVIPFGAAAGVADTTALGIPLGVVVGTNNRNPLFNTTYNTQYITDASPLASTTEFIGVEGPWNKGEQRAMVQIELITPETILRGQLFKTTFGVAMDVGTVTTGDTNGVSCTTGTLVASTAQLATLFFRSGANRGAYRVLDNTSATAQTWDTPTYAAVAVGDTCVKAPIRYLGPAYADFDAESMFIDAAATYATNYHVIDVIRLDLSVPGGEYVDFKFNADHFCLKRA
ncbi:MAG: hypothetical protein A2W23_03125 [Planctomycetes bacterium RBG_16_43_13]|nr:MAG: hypothetical protein A2W23_03125 [Planctomycetes bacterium RBG_16_43_13]